MLFLESFLDVRYVSAVEAAWRLFALSMQGKSHSIVPLHIHLENERLTAEARVLDPDDVEVPPEEDDPFGADDYADAPNARPRLPAIKSTLRAYFDLNRSDPEARELFYWQIPEKYKWNASLGKWERRQRLRKVIGRLYSVSPRNTTLSRLRLLLLHVKGATSFEDLKKVGNRVYDTFDEACLAQGLILDDTEWHRCLEEAALTRSGKHLRRLFATILVHCDVTDPAALWETFKVSCFATLLQMQAFYA